MNTDKTRLAVSYARKSTPDDMGLQQQHMINTERAAADGFEIPADARYRFGDDNTSGNKTSRPSLDALTALVTSGEAEFTRVYIKDITREGRFDDPRFHFYLQVLFQKHGVLICYSDQDQHLDFSNGFDMAQTGPLITEVVRAANSSGERQTLRTRVTDGGRAWVKLGFYPNGNVPYALQRFHADERTGEVLGPVDENRRALIKGQRFKLRFRDDEQRHAVVEIFEKILDGESVAAVARYLTARGIPSPGGERKWQPEAVRRIATHPIYTGRLEWGRTTRDEPALPPGETLIKGGAAPMLIRDFVPDAPITEAMFDAVQIALQGRSDEYRRRRRASPDFLLSGLLKCPQCGRHWHGFTSSKRSSNHRRRYYRHASAGAAGAPECQYDNRYLQADAIDGAITELIERLLTGSRLETAVRDALQHMASETGLAEVHRDLSAIQREEASVFNRLRQLVDDRASAASRIERDACQAQIDLHTRRADDLSARREALEKQNRHLERVGKSVDALPGRALQLAERLRQAEPRAHQSVCRSLIHKVEVASETELEVTLTPLSA